MKELAWLEKEKRFEKLTIKTPFLGKSIWTDPHWRYRLIHRYERDENNKKVLLSLKQVLL